MSGKDAQQKRQAHACLRLLEDRPNAPPEVVGLFEQDSIADSLLETALSFFADRHAPTRSQGKSCLIALHGRQGQGKSRVIEQVKSSLHDSFVPSREGLIHVSCRTFQCAEHPPEALIERFDHFLNPPRIFAIATITFFMAVLGLLFLSNVLAVVISDPIPGMKEPLPVLVVALFIALFSPLRHVWVYALREIRFGTSAARALRDALVMFRRDDILIVDDLDRATAEQQTALLQALNRHRRRFTGVVVVAFDDTPLIESMGSRREGSELMTKIFDVSFRLSPMSAADAGKLAERLCQKIAIENADCRVAELFKHPMVAGALARVLILNGTASARYARKLVNGVFAAAHHAQLGAVADVIARIRLQGILQHLPVIETELDFLAQSLMESDPESLFQRIEERFGFNLDAIPSARLRQLVEATRHMQPVVLDWMRLLRIWRKGETLEPFSVPRGWNEQLTCHWAQNEAMLARHRDPSQRLMLYRQMWQRPLATVSDNELDRPTPRQVTAASRLVRGRDVAELAQTLTGQSFHSKADFPPRDSVRKEIASRTEDEQMACEEFAHAMIAGLIVFDAVAFDLATADERQMFADRHHLMPIPTLVFSTPERIVAGNPREIAAHVRHFKLNPHDRIRHELARWFPDRNLPRNYPMVAADVVSLGERDLDAWPRFSLDSDIRSGGSIWRAHFRELGRLLAIVPPHIECLPMAHREWITSALQADKDRLIVNAIHVMAEAAYNPGMVWPYGTFRRIWKELQSQAVTARIATEFLRQLSSNKASPINLLVLTDLPESVELAFPPTINLRSTLIRISHESNTPDWQLPFERLRDAWPQLDDELVALAG